MTIIDCISDLHGHYPKLDGGDLLIVAGDLTARHTEKEWHEFATWMNDQNYEKIIFIAGNHDTMIEKWDKEQDEEGFKGPVSDPNYRIEYLCDSGTVYHHYERLEIGGIDTIRRHDLKIWGSPWTKSFPGMNPKCKAFTVDTEEELADKFSLIPNDIDILITHSPPFGILDQAKKFNYPETNTRIGNFLNGKYEHAGSKSLDKKIGKMKDFPALHVWGHIHEAYGQEEVTYDGKLYKMVNASIVNEHYQPVNKPIRVIL